MRFCWSFSPTKGSGRSFALLEQGALLLAALLLVGGQAATPAAAAEPVLAWELAKDGKKHCLVAAVPALTPRDPSLPPSVEDCYSRAARLAFETLARARLDEVGYVEWLGRAIGRRTAGDLEILLGSEMYRRFVDRVSELGVAPAQFDAFQPWFAAEMLHAFISVGTPARSDLGVERQLYRRSWKDRKEVMGLESELQHAERLAGQSEQAGRERLQLVLDGAGTAAPFAQRIEQWRRGDLEATAAQLAQIKRRYPSLYQEEYVDRHEAWMPTLLELLEQPTPQVIVLDLLHLAGPDGILQRLHRAERPLRPVVAEVRRRRSY